MDKKVILENLIKENRGALRQLTYLNNEIKELKDRVRKLEEEDSHITIKQVKKHKILFNNCVDDDEALLHKGEIKGFEIGDGF